MTSTAIAAQVNCLEIMGITDWKKLKEWSQNRSVTLRCIITKKYNTTLLKRQIGQKSRIG